MSLLILMMAMLVIGLGVLAWGPSEHGQHTADEGKE
jgi:hypothetical protein